MLMIHKPIWSVRTIRHTHTHTHTHIQNTQHTHTDIHTQTQIHKYTHAHTDRQTQTQTDTHTHIQNTHTHTHRNTNKTGSKKKKTTTKNQRKEKSCVLLLLPSHFTTSRDRFSHNAALHTTEDNHKADHVSMGIRVSRCGFSCVLAWSQETPTQCGDPSGHCHSFRVESPPFQEPQHERGIVQLRLLLTVCGIGMKQRAYWVVLRLVVLEREKEITNENTEMQAKGEREKKKQKHPDRKKQNHLSE
jgi:hypothetical protein